MKDKFSKAKNLLKEFTTDELVELNEYISKEIERQDDEELYGIVAGRVLLMPYEDEKKKRKLMGILKADSCGNAQRSAFVERSGDSNFTMGFRLRQVG